MTSKSDEIAQLAQLVPEDAESYLVSRLRTNPREFRAYGYDVYIYEAVTGLLEGKHLRELDEGYHQIRLQLSSVFLAAGWELARRGIIRPGVREYGAQVTDTGQGAGYCITPFGQRWLSEDQHDDFVPTEPGRFAEMMAPFKARFGPGFHQRAQQAVRCYGSHTYLACCVMCGAAAESIMLAAAIAHAGDEEAVLKYYQSAAGRSKIENLLVGKVIDPIRREFKGLTVLLKYWRDAAAHGRATDISDNEAFTSVSSLLRFAQFVDDNWEALTTGTGG